LTGKGGLLDVFDADHRRGGKPKRTAYHWKRSGDSFTEYENSIRRPWAKAGRALVTGRELPEHTPERLENLGKGEKTGDLALRVGYKQVAHILHANLGRKKVKKEERGLQKSSLGLQKKTLDFKGRDKRGVLFVTK